MSAKPTIGESLFDWNIVTSAIENKLCDEIYKQMVYPNLIDVIIPLLGAPTYKEWNQILKIIKKSIYMFNFNHKILIYKFFFSCSFFRKIIYLCLE